MQGNSNCKPLIIERKKPRILFDQDDVLFDFVGEVIRRHNKKTGQNRNIDECLSWNMEKHYGKGIMDIVYEPDFFASLKPKEESIEVFKRMYLSGKYDIRIVTAAMPHGYMGKIESIKKHLPFFDLKHFIACSDKGSVWGDFLIDDAIHNLEAFSHTGEGILFDMPHNKSDEKFKRVCTLQDAEKYINECCFENGRP